MPEATRATQPRWVKCPQCQDTHLHHPDFDADLICEVCIRTPRKRIEVVGKLGPWAAEETTDEFVARKRQEDPDAPWEGTIADVMWKESVLQEFNR